MKLTSIIIILNFIIVPISQAGKWMENAFKNDHGQRDYSFYIPTGYKPNQKRPLLVGLHGCLNPAEKSLEE